MVSIPLSNVSWGPIDALERDLRFIDKWIEPAGIKRCLSPRSWIVSGEKGSGKSAIRKAMTEIYKDHIFAIAEVDFQDITFTALYNNLLHLTQTASLSNLSLMSNYWQYAIFVEVVNACAEREPQVYGAILEAIPTRRRAAPLNQRMLELLQEAWNKIDNLTGSLTSEKRKPANLVASDGLTAQLVQDLSKFPLDRHFDNIKNRFFQIVEQRGDRVVLILDGFDRLRNDNAPADAIRLIFASLVDSILSVKTYKHLPQTLEIKAFIPHDRYLALSLRDNDKVEAMHSSIKWDVPALQQLVGRRIALATKQHGLGFPSLWKQVFPEQIMNSRHHLQEESFDYILRHTMYRPRHLQMHLINLAEEHEGKDIDPSLVPKCISKSSKEVAKNFVNEYSIDYPWLQDLAQFFHRRDNIMSYKDFCDHIHGFLKRNTRGKNLPAVDDMVDNLYSMGFFGLLHFVDPGEENSELAYLPTRQSRRHYVEFFYKDPKMSIHGSLQADSHIALHPVFIDYVGLRSVPDIIIG